MPSLTRIRSRRVRPADRVESDVVTYDEDGVPVLASQVNAHTADFVIDTAEGDTIGFGDLGDERGLALSGERTERALALVGYGRDKHR
jgi:hypothetical protein